MKSNVKKIVISFDFQVLTEEQLKEIVSLRDKYYPAVEFMVDNLFRFTNGFNILDNVNGKFTFPDLKTMDNFLKELKPILEK